MLQIEFTMSLSLSTEYTDAGPASPGTDPRVPGAWQGSPGVPVLWSLVGLDGESGIWPLWDLFSRWTSSFKVIGVSSSGELLGVWWFWYQEWEISDLFFSSETDHMPLGINIKLSSLVISICGTKSSRGHTTGFGLEQLSSFSMCNRVLCCCRKCRQKLTTDQRFACINGTIACVSCLIHSVV